LRVREILWPDGIRRGHRSNVDGGNFSDWVG
jgi:hypothetical protein